MKKLLTIAACFCALTAFNAYAQGTVAFGNRVTGVLDAPVFDVGGTVRLEGPAMAQLYVGGAAVGAPVAFRTGAGAGYWPTTSVTLPGVAAGAQATVEVRAWKDAATYEAALVSGKSTPVTITTGGAGSPPTLPANLAGLTSFTLQIVPEPSMIALGLLGAAGLMLRRRK